MNVINSIKAIVILQGDGRRTLAKYYDDHLRSTAKQFEKKLFMRTKKADKKCEIIVLDGYLIVHKFLTDSHVYIIGDRNENPVILDKVSCCLAEIINSFSVHSMGRNLILDNKTKIILALDEICDSGMILEIEPEVILERITATYHESDLESMGQRVARRFLGIY